MNRFEKRLEKWSDNHDILMGKHGHDLTVSDMLKVEVMMSTVRYGTQAVLILTGTLILRGINQAKKSQETQPVE